MNRKPIVFAGPTISKAEIEYHIDAIVMPPAAAGSIVKAMSTYKPSTIILIDGVLVQHPAVRHKEIMWALSKGVEVWGCSSIGALRAAELVFEGMRGWGLVYRWYRRTALADDDEVVVATAPPELGYAALSDALIDMRLSLRLAYHQGIISRELTKNFEAIARNLHFTERSYNNMFLRAQEHRYNKKYCSELMAWLIDNKIRQKKTDALDLLDHLSASRSTIHANETVNFVLTEAWAADLDASLLFDIYEKEAQYKL